MSPSLPLLLAAALALPARATVEEERLPRAAAAMPAVIDAFAGLVGDFGHDWSKARDAREAQALAREYGRRLWLGAKAGIRQRGDFDDRPLYWGRLALTRTLREQPPGFPIFAADRAAALDALEQASRGMDEVDFGADRKTLRILVTGFDPFLLDRNLDQSNPSGVNALLLDGEEIEFDGRRARIETAMFPVRYADFDAGMVERLLSPWMRGKNGKPQVDLVATVSMGRTGFDLERFPGRRRSTEARVPDNLNVPSGASRDDPRPPLLDGRPIDGPEFVEFSLPAAAMLAVQAPYRVNDNRQVTVVPDTQLSADSLAALRGKIAVEGSGGGYLSNEISYRSVRLRDALGVARLPVGHIHTPAIKAFEPDKTARIVDQLRALLGAAAATLPQR